MYLLTSKSNVSLSCKPKLISLDSFKFIISVAETPSSVSIASETISPCLFALYLAATYFSLSYSKLMI